MSPPRRSLLTLVHLISAEVQPNILPILAFRPTRVIQIYSNASFRDKADQIRTAVQRLWGGLVAEAHANDPPEFLDPVLAPIGGASPVAVARLIERILATTAPHGPVLINYTAGTKNMSIGAWLTAQALGLPSVYCDTPRGFLSGDTGILLPHETLQELALRLHPTDILGMEGKWEGQHYHCRRLRSPLTDFYTEAARLMTHHGAAVQAFRTAWGRWTHYSGSHPASADFQRVQHHGQVALQFTDSAAGEQQHGFG